jgi:hypothetical protein
MCLDGPFCTTGDSGFDCQAAAWRAHSQQLPASSGKWLHRSRLQLLQIPGSPANLFPPCLPSGPRIHLGDSRVAAVTSQPTYRSTSSGLSRLSSTSVLTTATSSTIRPHADQTVFNPSGVVMQRQSIRDVGGGHNMQPTQASARRLGYKDLRSTLNVNRPKHTEFLCGTSPVSASLFWPTEDDAHEDALAAFMAAQKGVQAGASSPSQSQEATTKLGSGSLLLFP